MVDWSPGADANPLIDLVEPSLLYATPCQNTRVVAKQLQLLLQQLHSEVGMQYDDVHIIGHSLGAHAAGYTGALLDGRIGRISGEKEFISFNGIQTGCV